ncbi:MAG TPA: hypothetical protein PLP29_11680 [Candidatus Ozemobacteraceae bacterium]|nr:hypothetical protein [Candidatus Ozemobacteraceae bacterium]
MSEGIDPRKPAWVERVPTRVAGKPSTRLIFIFRAPGCAYARRPGGGCTNCGFGPMTFEDTPWTPADLMAQAEAVFGIPGVLDGVGEVDLYNSGSFYADAELPPEVRSHVLGLLGAAGVPRILVESRPEFITPERIAASRALLPKSFLEVGIGLESADEVIRERFINKGFGLPEFERAARVLAEAGAGLLVNVLLKPLGAADDAAAVADAVNTGNYIFDLARRLSLSARVALQPVFVAPGTPLEREFLAGRYRPVSLWAVVEAVAALAGLGETTVGLSDEGLEPKRVPAGCGRCDASIRDALRAFNRTGDPAPLRTLTCRCRVSRGG